MTVTSRFANEAMHKMARKLDRQRKDAEERLADLEAQSAATRASIDLLTLQANEIRESAGERIEPESEDAA